ncbi:MAG TPA: proteasome assembly chaperone family protein [Thermoplasmata archaeon]|nr:proteasome assembly chaperone family protein [Thermoplasmata archaeon]
MEDIVIRYIEKPHLRNVIFIEGLPGVGNVGKLAVDHLIDEIKCKKFACIYSKYFPPQVLVKEDNLVHLVNNELYYWKSPKPDGNDLIFLCGDYQGLTPEGQYELSDRILREVMQYDIKQIITLGGYGHGEILKEPRVLGAANNKENLKMLKNIGVICSSDTPGSGIVGASGLLIGLGKLYGIKGLCLMGETSGYFVDPKSAKALLEKLTIILGIEVSYTELENKAKQIEEITRQLREMEKNKRTKTSSENLSYIG